MSLDDHRLQAQLRVLLLREWVDLTELEYTVLNGVVYLTGTLRHHLCVNGGAPEVNGQGNGNAVHLATGLESGVKRIPGVRDVVFRLNNIVKLGETWHAA